MPVHPTLRTLSRTPGFSLLAIMTMALGIGATSALFSVVDAVILQPLAFPHPERIVALNTSWPAKDKQIPRLTGGDLVDLRSALHSFSALSFYGGGQMGVRLRDEARFADTFQVDPAFFHALHVTAAAGRLPQQADEGHTAVLTKSFASANWGDSAKALGQTVMVDNKPYRVIGLLEDKLAFPEKAEVWITGSSTPDNLNRTAYNYRAIASFQPGVTLAHCGHQTGGCLSGLESGQDVSRRTASGSTHRPGSHHAAVSVGRGGTAAADLMRQRRQPDAGACSRPHA
jgi:putative ABC transport system permease protein